MNFVQDNIGRPFKTNYWDVDDYMFVGGSDPNIISVFKIDFRGHRKHEGIIYLHQQSGDTIVAYATLAGCLGKIEIPISRIRFTDGKDQAA